MIPATMTKILGEIILETTQNRGWLGLGVNRVLAGTIHLTGYERRIAMEKLAGNKWAACQRTHLMVGGPHVRLTGEGADQNTRGRVCSPIQLHNSG